ncbi:MAG: hypothetical protein VB066_01785 [Paludibacter sp.]|nr:hypothetical protein [Paludibacter sp.]
MKTKIILTAISLLFVVGGCNTVRQTKSTKLTNTTENMTVKQSSVQNNDITFKADNKLTNNTNSSVSDNSQIAESIVEETTTTNFSAPDSTGRQYPTSQTNIKRTTNRNENRNLQINQQQQSDSDNKIDLSDKSDYKSDHSLKQDNKIKSSDNESVFATNTIPFSTYIIIAFIILIVIAVSKPSWFISAFKWILKLLRK